MWVFDRSSLVAVLIVVRSSRTEAWHPLVVVVVASAVVTQVDLNSEVVMSSSMAAVPEVSY
jgi:hypothetical protein